MFTRRQFVGRGLGAVAMGFAAARPAWAAWLGSGPRGGAGPASASDPVARLRRPLQSVLVGGFPFQDGFTGDGFPELGETHVELPPFIQPLNERDLPAPEQAVRVAVIGGGISGLTVAYLLRDLAPVVLDAHPRFGGAARGEDWSGIRYSLGNAYVITPDKGSFLEGIYRELGLPEVAAVSDDPDPVEIDGAVLEDFWVDGLGGDPGEVAALAEYADVVRYFAEKAYPEIPYPPQDEKWIFELDQKTLKQDIEERMSLPVPPLLESAIQGYCFSSFGAGWDQISAASGWNFVAAEEYGRWVFPGGTSYLSRALWSRLHQASGSEGSMLRGGCVALDVRLRDGSVLVTYRDPQGALRSLLAERVVMACPKFVCKHVIRDLAAMDSRKFDAINQLQYTPYLVANVLVDRPLKLDFYDIFLLGDSGEPLGFWNPCGKLFKMDDSPVTDVLDGAFARPRDLTRSVLTLYWPLMCPLARYDMLVNDPWRRWTERLAVQLDGILGLLDMTRDDVVQVRMSRWGHAMPVAAPNLIASGATEHLRRPIDDRIYFVNQDNWALPAVENSMLDAQIMADQIREALGG